MSLASPTALQMHHSISRLAETFELASTSNLKTLTEPKGRKHKDTEAPQEVQANPPHPCLVRKSTISMASSPVRGLSGSPRLSSPAGSMIFERDVQESAIPIFKPPAIPSHIQTENHIPPVLDASSEAITDNHLDPDSVAIVTHASHQPAAMAVAGLSSAPFSASAGQHVLCDAGVNASWADELAAFADKQGLDSASNYGSLDNATADIRRLSFISFADVVQAEQHQLAAGGLGAPVNRDSFYLAGLTSLPSASARLVERRSPSPIRSLISSSVGGQGAGTIHSSAPTSKSGSVSGDLSPSRKPLGSPTSMTMAVGLAGGGELNIETMTQALRRTGSNDLNVMRSGPHSPI